jgi:hypothetical protein
MTPEMETIAFKANKLLMASGVNSDLGIGYGGVDEGGTLDPAAPGLGGLTGLPDFIFK